VKDFQFVDAVSGAPLSRVRIAVREANAEIQPGNYFGRFDRVDNIARRVGFFIAWRLAK